MYRLSATSRIISGIVLVFVVFQACIPARKAMYFPDLKSTQITIDSLGRETAKKVYPGDRVMVEIITNDQEGMLLMNQGMKMSGSIGGNNQQTQGYLVDPEGYIQIPTIGKIQVQGHTPNEIREIVHAKVTELYWDATVYCQISGRVVILNSLNQSTGGMAGSGAMGSGVLSIPLTDERLTIPEVLSGLRTNNLRLDKAWIIREVDGKRVVASLNLNTMEILQSPYFYLRNNDIIYIEPNKLNQFLEANLPARNLVGLITGFSGLVFGLIALFN